MNTPFDQPPQREDVIAAYRVLLARDPESERAIAWHLQAAATRRDLLANILRSDEYRAGAACSAGPPPAAAATRLAEFLRQHGQPATSIPDACWVDALGVVTRVQWRADYAGRAGRQVPAIDPGQELEWLALTDALQCAGASFCAIELGAGHAPWLARAGVVWRRWRGRAPLRLVGIEGEATHCAFARQHLRDNGLEDQVQYLHEVAVAAHDATVRFECATDPANDWGTRLCDAHDAPAGLPRVNGAATHELPAWSLPTLLARAPVVDLLHVDIQGSEADVLLAGGEALARRVRRLFVGTHGRGIEERLIATLPGLGFRLLEERACRYRFGAGAPVLVEDGAQYWCNTRELDAP